MIRESIGILKRVVDLLKTHPLPRARSGPWMGFVSLGVVPVQPWHGKHMWVWILDQVGPPEKVVEGAVTLGLSGILVKAWDGSTSGSFLRQFSSIVGPAHEVGLIVGAWGYSYGSNISGEVKATRSALDAGADWIVIDAEVEYEIPQGKERALALGRSLEKVLPRATVVGYTTFAIPDYHPAFPYKEFSSFCSVCLPQIYWGLMKMPLDRAFTLSLEGLSKYGVPVAPVGQCFGQVTADEIVRFASLSRDRGLPGISYYDWQHATRVQLEAVGSAPYGPYENVSSWARVSWNKAVRRAVLDGTDPKGPVTREMLAVVLDRLRLLDS